MPSPRPRRRKNPCGGSRDISHVTYSGTFNLPHPNNADALAAAVRRTAAISLNASSTPASSPARGFHKPVDRSGEPSEDIAPPRQMKLEKVHCQAEPVHGRPLARIVFSALNIA